MVNAAKILPKPRQLLIMAYLALVLVPMTSIFVDMPVYLHMILVTVLCVYTGSWASVLDYSKEAAVDGKPQQIERLTTNDAYMFPVFGSIVLFSLYLSFKFLPREYLDILIKLYFFFLGTMAVMSLINIVANLIWGPKALEKSVGRELFVITIQYIQLMTSPFEIAIPWVTCSYPKPKDKQDWKSRKRKQEEEKTSADDEEELDMTTLIPMRIMDLYFLFIALGVSVWYLYTNHWLANNIIGMCFAIQAISFIHLGSFYNGFLLLTGLFFYDIFWVFGTEVMVEVAKNFDAPIKLLFPRPAVLPRPSMLGLGDIVMPGVFAALMLRFDQVLQKKGMSNSNTYFKITVLAYFIGLSVCVFIMYKFEAAQPALLYLVPSCLGLPSLWAMVRGQFKELWIFEELDPEEAVQELELEKKDR